MKGYHKTSCIEVLPSCCTLQPAKVTKISRNESHTGSLLMRSRGQRFGTKATKAAKGWTFSDVPMTINRSHFGRSFKRSLMVRDIATHSLEPLKKLLRKIFAKESDVRFDKPSTNLTARDFIRKNALCFINPDFGRVPYLSLWKTQKELYSRHISQRQNCHELPLGLHRECLEIHPV